MRIKNKVVLFLQIDPHTKTWLKKLCKKQIGRVSQSTMAERIFVAAKKNAQFMKAV
jgi:hypothetical protein